MVPYRLTYHTPAEFSLGLTMMGGLFLVLRQGEQCVTCNWYDHRCSPVVIYFVASGLIAIAMCIACYKQSGGTS
jgi:hypothetical protein